MRNIILLLALCAPLAAAEIRNIRVRDVDGYVVEESGGPVSAAGPGETIYSVTLGAVTRNRKVPGSGLKYSAGVLSTFTDADVAASPAFSAKTEASLIEKMDALDLRIIALERWQASPLRSKRNRQAELDAARAEYATMEGALK